MADSEIPMPDSVLSLIDSPQVQLYSRLDPSSDLSLQSQLFKSQGDEAHSRQGISLGEQQHPYDFNQVKAFSNSNEHHQACINTKVSATVGLGFIDGQETIVAESPIAEATPPPGADERTGLPASEQLPMQSSTKIYVDSKVDLKMNPLCMFSATDLLHDVCEDYWTTGNGYVEVVRKVSGGEIAGLHHLPSEQVMIFVEDVDYNFHYIVTKENQDQGSRRFARFGDWEDFKSRTGEGAGTFEQDDPAADAEFVSEVIHFRQPSSMNKWYGFAKWLSAVPPIELAQMLLQWKFDFFLNRGVPEFIFLLTGTKIKKDDWKKIEDALKSNIGLGNSHKSLALNIANPDVKAQVEKLAAESKGEDTFAMTKESLGLSIVTAHSVPPLLAGIMIPGKLGATNELPNALMAFQLLVIGPAQRLFQQTLATTLGAENGIDGLESADFAFTKITEEIDLGTMDTVARMRQSPSSAAAEGRDLDEGLKE